jgi:mannose-6-phosphate isomerase-like protein (cupin superfamily)
MHSPADPNRPRVVIVDDHEVSRAACRALLRTEGVDVLADIAADDRAVATVTRLRPDVVLIDVCPGDRDRLAIVRAVESLPTAPAVVVTSSAECACADAELRSRAFVAKADVSSAALASVARSSATVRFGRGLGTRKLISGADTGGRFALIEHDLPPRQLGAPIHTHTREDEHSFVLAGTITVLIGERLLEAGSGEVVTKPRGIPHAFWNAGPEPARLLELISPAGFEQFFFDVAPRINAGDHAGGADIAARYGLETRPESVPELIQRHRLDPAF